MNVHHAKFQKKFDSRTISRELPYKNQNDSKIHNITNFEL